ncbi:MAG: macrolide ABC transporter ATP-binding protein [Actinobacteria bacterium HGW-Actinobacteria-6]|nr:MAG: macrolide ABC transporter ATP-binding protein [Actinobacteria bacterium HGW-Actinobacteria-6]
MPDGTRALSRVVLETRDVGKQYKLDGVEVNALRGVSIAIRAGEMVTIMGPSGSGKSTLMHIVGLLDQPTTGEVILEGDDVSGLSPNQLSELRNKHIGFVFQSFNLLARTTAQVNVELPLVYAGISGSERSRRAKEALERVALGDRLSHFSSQLSGGQQQRVAIARALVNNPSIVLADEPTGNLDSRSGIEVMAILQELNDQGITVILVTHDDRVARHAQRIIHVFDGHVQSEEIVLNRILAGTALATLPAEEVAG